VLAPCGRLIASFGCLIGLGLVSRDLVPEATVETSQAPVESLKTVTIPHGAFPLLLACPEVRAELELDVSQNKQLDRWLIRMLGQYAADSPAAAVDELTSLDSGDRELLAQTLRTLSNRALRDAEAQLSDILHLDQLARLHQLRTQREGLVALQRPEIRDQLQLSRIQRDRINRLPQFCLSPSLPREETTTFDEDLAEILTASQYDQWQHLKGVSFAFPPMQTAGLQPRVLQLLLAFNPRTSRLPMIDVTQTTLPEHVTQADH